jgi:hypothetical protein
VGPVAARPNPRKNCVENLEKDLGPRTAQLAPALKSYDPDGTWTLVRRNEFLTNGLSPLQSEMNVNYS